MLPTRFDEEPIFFSANLMSLRFFRNCFIRNALKISPPKFELWLLGGCYAAIDSCLNFYLSDENIFLSDSPLKSEDSTITIRASSI